jgi:hypothetical protein
MLKKDPDKREQKTGRAKIAALSSTILWVVAFILLFVIPGGSKFIWLSDFLLLLGFFPLLWVYPAGWTWLIFGILNTFIGLMLFIGYYLPNLSSDVETMRGHFSQIGYFMPSGAEVEKMRQMLQSSHPAWVWVVLGLVCTIFGAFRMIKNTVRLMVNLKGRGKGNQHSEAVD